MTRRNKILIFILIVSIVFALVTGFLNQSLGKLTGTGPTPTPAAVVDLIQQFRIIRTEPLEQVEVVSTQPTLMVQFNKETTSVSVEIKLEPEVPLTLNANEDRTVYTAIPQRALQPNTLYRANVYLNGNGFHQWQFRTGEETITSSDQNALLKIKQKLPYQGSHFRIIYNSTLDEFQVFIDAKPVNTYFQNALSWFRNEGLTNTEAVKIVEYPIGAAARP
jgi:hypothetical protein